jgi:threonylcarbamoyladenosine tRNA methylthiotransferase MtaB
MTKFAFYTLGCKTNQYETNLMKAQAEKEGFAIVPFEMPADFYVINTCTVTQNADKKSRHAIRAGKKLNPKAKVIVTGCLAETEPLDNLKEIDLVIKNKDKKDLIKIIQENFSCVRVGGAFLLEAPACRTGRNPPLAEAPQQTALKGRLREPMPVERVRAFLMIEDGCPGNCSYCIVPKARGKKVISKTLSQVIAEAKELAAQGAREIILTGINLGAYEFDLPEVLRELDKIDGLYRIRLSSIEPMFVTKELIDTIATTPKACPHLHIPLQSGDQEILKAMQRPYSPEEYLALIEYAKKKIPEVGINTDIIVGFPGETEKQFRNSLKFAEEIGFSRIHIFTYSARKGTPAAELSGQINPKVQHERYQKLMNLRNKLMRNFAKQYQGKKIEILVESIKGKTAEGLTPNYVRFTTKAACSPGEILTLDSRDCTLCE